jgi:hypothetical protein
MSTLYSLHVSTIEPASLSSNDIAKELIMAFQVRLNDY